MKIEEVIRVINDIAAEYDVIGLTVSEHMPRVAIKIKNILNLIALVKRIKATNYQEPADRQ